MKVVALISGGKDSCFNMMHCVANGHEIVALANLKPKEKDELDSYMYQTVGHHVIEYYAEALGLPLFRRTISGTSICQHATYEESGGDEVEDLYLLLEDIKDKINFDGVSSGAILSNYQRVRVEHVCSRLGLQSLAYLWQRDQVELLDEMIQSGLDAILIKVATLGLDPYKHAGKTLKDMQSHLLKMKEKFELNVCGEGGEYETITLDCPLFKKKIVIDEQELIIHSDDAFAPVGYLTFKKMHLDDKNMNNYEASVKEVEKIRVPSLFGKDTVMELFTSISATSKHLTRGVTCDKTREERAEVVPLLIKPQVHKTKDMILITELFCICDDASVEISARKTMDTLKHIVCDNEYKMNDISLIHLFCSNMNNFARINSVYKEYFTHNPPARVCVEAPLHGNIVFKMEVCLHIAHTWQREALHVQSISYWAPGNIGPYSQAIKVGADVYFSGSIGMQPSTMEVVKGGCVEEACLSLHHVNVVSRAIAPSRNSSVDYGSVTCYITDFKFAEYVEEFFHQQTMFNSKSYLLNIVCVSRLPKNAQVEWHVTSHICDGERTECQDSLVTTRTTYQHNTGHVTTCVYGEDLKENAKLESALLQTFSACSSKLEKCFFLRVFYVHDAVENEDTLKKALHSAYDKQFGRSVVLSLIPSCGLYVPGLSASQKVTVLIHGRIYAYHGTSGNGNDDDDDG